MQFIRNFQNGFNIFLYDLYKNLTVFADRNLLHTHTPENYSAASGSISFLLLIYTGSSVSEIHQPFGYYKEISMLKSHDHAGRFPEDSIPDSDLSLELKAVMLNINKGHNRKLMETCRTLEDYAEYTFRVREYAAEMPLDTAVEQAITECISEGILTDFLRKN